MNLIRLTITESLPPPKKKKPTTGDYNFVLGRVTNLFLSLYAMEIVLTLAQEVSGPGCHTAFRSSPVVLLLLPFSLIYQLPELTNSTSR